MKFRIFCWLGVPVLIGVAAYFVATYYLRLRSVFPLSSDPVIDYPAKLDLGEHELGDQAVGRFTITNRGGNELIVDEIQTNCSCSGMEREHDGQYQRLESVRLKAGESADLAMRVTVRGVPAGAEMLNLIEFQTNDPAHPRGRIEVVVSHVTAGFSIFPPSIFLGIVPIGAQVRHLLEVRDTAAIPRTIERVTSTMPDRLTVRLLPIEEMPVDNKPNPKGSLVGGIEMLVDTAMAGEIRGALEVHLAGEQRNPDLVHVVGKVVAPIEIMPALLVLPRKSTAGPVYSANSICRSTRGEPLTLTVESAPLGLTAEVLGDGEPAVRVVRITCDPRKATTSAGADRQRIRLRAKAGKDEQVLELVVIVDK